MQKKVSINGNDIRFYKCMTSVLMLSATDRETAALKSTLLGSKATFFFLSEIDLFENLSPIPDLE